MGLNYDFEIVGILTLFPYFSVDPSFVTETGTCRQSPIEIAAEKDPELSLHLVKTRLSQLICQEGETVKAKEDFARFLKTVSPTKVRMVIDFLDSLPARRCFCGWEHIPTRGSLQGQDRYCQLASETWVGFNSYKSGFPRESGF